MALSGLLPDWSEPVELGQASGNYCDDPHILWHFLTLTNSEERRWHWSRENTGTRILHRVFEINFLKPPAPIVLWLWRLDCVSAPTVNGKVDASAAIYEANVGAASWKLRNLRSGDRWPEVSTHHVTVIESVWVLYLSLSEWSTHSRTEYANKLARLGKMIINLLKEVKNK